MRIRSTFMALLMAGSLTGQISKGGLPPGLKPENESFLASKTIVKQVIPKPDVQKWKQEDESSPYQARFAGPILTDITPQNSGSWTDLPDGRRLWRCAIEAPDALALVLLFDQFKLPEGCELYAYDAKHKRKLGAYTKESCIESGKFTIGPIPGQTTFLELVGQPTALDQAVIHLNRIDYTYHLGAYMEGDPAGALDFGQSLQCNVNINCSQAADWQVQKKGVARILMVFSNGSAWCSGSLMANTGNTGTPLFLTAHHCQIIALAPQFDQWAFHFDYESATCANPTSEPTFKSVLGCQRLSFRHETDFMLLQLNPIPPAYGVYFNGWSRANTAPATSAFIHHPMGDIKKFSRDDQAAVSHNGTINWGSGFGTSQPNTHWKVVPDVGIYEPGSSGCPIFDSNKRVVGQLHGGVANNCTITAAYFGMFHLSWDQGGTSGTQLKNWLDPGNTNAMTQDGYNQPVEPKVTISGQVNLWSGEPLVNTQMIISGGFSDTVLTDQNGNYTFTDVPTGQNYVIQPMRDINDVNGVTSYDLVLVSRHILNVESLGSPWKMIAADINESNTITNFDIVEGRKLILNIYNSFPATTSWRFFPANTTFPNPLNPFETPLPAGTISLTGITQNTTGVNFVGVKMGDMNASADPGQ